MNGSTLLIVRVWHQAGTAGGFRASVRAADAEEPRLFTCPEDVAGFLAQQAMPAVPAHEDARRDE